MFYTTPTGGPGDGLFWTEREPICLNRSGAAYAEGEVVMIDLKATTTELATGTEATYQPGSSESIWRTIIDPITAYENSGFMGIVTEPGGIADNAKGKVTFFGLIERAFIRSALAIGAVPGDKLVMDVSASNNALTVVPAANATNARIIGYYSAPTDTTLTNRALKRVMFNGFTGWGQP